MIFNSFPSMYVHMAADSFVLSAEHQRLVTIVDVCVAAVVIYDYLLTLGDEIELMWTSKSSVTKALYLIQRYLPFIDTVIMIMYTDFTPNRFCHLAITVSGYMYVFSIASSEVILSLRVLATWQRARKVAIGLSISFLLCFLPVFVLMGLFLTTVKFGNSPLPGLGCYTLDGSSILVGCWMLLMLYDAGTMVLMIVAGVSAYKTGGSTALFNAVYRDGILYYIFLFLLSLTNVLVIIVFPRDLASLLSSTERVMHSILTSRVVHQIRRQVKAPGTPSQAFDIDNHEMDLGTVHFHVEEQSSIVDTFYHSARV